MTTLGSAQRIIWDTDLDSDCDDLSATAMLFGLVASNEAQIIAATLASENAYSASAMRSLLDEAGLSTVPVGAYQGSAIGGPTDSLYTQQIASEYGATPGQTRVDFPTAVSVMRQALASSPDGSVKLITGGTLTNIAALLKSPGDAISPLSGMDLVRLKAEGIYSMGGNFVSSSSPENNIRFDISAANYVAGASPVPVFWAGKEVGDTIHAHVPLDGTIDDPFERGWSLSSSQLVGGERPTWDLVGIYYAVRGPGSLFSLGGTNGTLSFDANSYTHYAANAGGRNSFLTKMASDAEIGTIFDDLIADGVALHANKLPTGTVTISGSAIEDSLLSASNTLADADGLGAISYQWLRNGSTISGATGATYRLGQVDVGSAIAVRASYTDGRGTLEAKSSSATGSVANVNDLPTGNITISGSAVVGSTLSAISTLADEDGPGALSYQWLRNGAAISGSTSASYTLLGSDAGASISVRASYVDGRGTSESKTSSPTAPVSPAPNNLPTGTVTISGSAIEDSLLSASNTLADADGLGAISYQWLRNGSTISGATGSTYRLGQVDVGTAIAVRASYTDGRGTVEAKSSSATGSVTNVNDLPTGNITISGSAVVGSTLTAISTLADEDGLGALSYQWLRNGAAISGSTSASYTLLGSDAGGSLSVRASYVDGRGTSESKTSSPLSVTSPNAYTGTEGADLFRATNNGDWLISGLGGNDSLEGLGGRDTLNGGFGDDVLTGGSGDDTLFGEAGSDSLSGGAGPDRMAGGVGNDTYWVDAAGDVVAEDANAGKDSVRATISYQLAANVEDLTLVGSGAISGTGNALANRIEANLGSNILTGQGGADLFVFKGNTTDQIIITTGATQATRDTITDFQKGVDRIDLSRIDAVTEKAGRAPVNDAFESVSFGSAFRGNSAGAILYHYEVVNGVALTIVYGNVDKDSDIDFQIALIGHLYLTSSDFVM